MMEPGKVLSTFKAKNGISVVLRTPDMHDLSDMLKFINDLVVEKAMIATSRKQTLESEADYLSGIISSNIKGNAVHIVAEVNGHMIGKGDVTRGSDESRHTGTLGISLAKNYRSIGIGTALVKELLKQAKKLGIKLVYLEVFANNVHAQNLYKKMGFEITGALPKKLRYGGKYVDAVFMAKKL
ncbi:MAG: GNAT family N-acetyltransferase [Candidatus Micrarchaeia archaeon]